MLIFASFISHPHVSRGDGMFIQKLEQRRLLTISLNSSGDLIVQGTPSGDFITVATNGSQLEIDDGHGPQTFDVASVNAFDIETLGGPDKIQVDANTTI